MQTPLNEEKNPKWGREEGSSSGTQAFNAQYERGQRKRLILCQSRKTPIAQLK